MYNITEGYEKNEKNDVFILNGNYNNIFIIYDTKKLNFECICYNDIKKNCI